MAAAPGEAGERLLYRSNAGVICQERYAATGDATMLEQAVTAFESAARLADPDDPDLPQYLSNLSNALVHQFAAGRDDDDLAHALAAADRAVQVGPRRSPDPPPHLNNFPNPPPPKDGHH